MQQLVKTYKSTEYCYHKFCLTKRPGISLALRLLYFVNNLASYEAMELLGAHSKLDAAFDALDYRTLLGG